MSMGGYSQSYKYIADNGGYSQTSSDTEFTFTLANGGVSQTFKFKKLQQQNSTLITETVLQNLLKNNKMKKLLFTLALALPTLYFAQDTQRDKKCDLPKNYQEPQPDKKIQSF